MNIFVLHTDPKIAATMHLDKHVVKMILEYGQLLSTAHRLQAGKDPSTVYVERKSGPKARQLVLLDGDIVQVENDLPMLKETFIYLDTHANHPCGKWVRDSKSNYIWTHDLLTATCKEYTHRYGKVHKMESSGLLDILKTPPLLSPEIELTPFELAMPDEYKVDCPVESYRRYYLGAKKNILSYKNRKAPEWINT